MARKQSGESGKKEAILAAAQEIFLEKGFDGTSVRAIMKKAGGEIGLFYYYFKSKDAVFDCVLDRFFAGYKADFTRIVAHGERNPCRLMEEFFDYVETATAEFRRQYAPKMHRTVRWAIREHTMEIIEPYLQQIVRIQSAYYGIAPAIAPDAAALYLTYGVCSSILHEDAARYFAFRQDIKQGVSLLMGMPLAEQALRIPEPAKESDTPGWMALLDTVSEQFPGLCREEHQALLAGRIAAGEAWVVRTGTGIAAALLYSKARSSLDFLAVHPAYRRRGLGGRLVETAAAQFPIGAALSVITYRDSDPAGAAAQAFYQSLGFSRCGLLTQFGYPCQQLRLIVGARSPVRNRPADIGPSDGASV